MKTNLSNRPKLADLEPRNAKLQSLENLVKHMNKTEAWFESFEKQLREAYETPEKLTGEALLIPRRKATKEELQYRAGWRQATFRAIREILGTEEAVSK